MEPQQVESDVIAVQPVTEDYFKPGLYDGRFLSNDFMKFQTTCNILSDPIEIVLPGNLFNQKDSLFSLKVKLFPFFLALRSQSCYKVITF